MKLLLIGKIPVIKAVFAGLMLSNTVIEPPSMQAANELLLKEDFDMVLYGVHTNPDGSHIKRSMAGKMEIIHVAEKFTCEGTL